MDGGGMVRVQKSIRDNANEVEGYLTDLNAWTLEMKAKELAASNTDLVMQPVENIPLRNDPTKSKGGGNKGRNNNEVENQEVLAKKERRTSVDYDAWDKYDADKACEEVELKYPVKVETDEEKIKRRAIELRLRHLADEKKALGNQHLKDKNYDKAIECYSDAIRCDSKNAVLYGNRAQAFMFKKEFLKVVEDCTSSISNDASYVKAYFRRAKARLELGKLNEAKEDVNATLKLDPSNVEAKQLLAQISKKTMSTLFGPAKLAPITPSSTTPTPSTPTVRNSFFPGVRTVMGTGGNNLNFLSSRMMDDDDDDLHARGDSAEDKKQYPKKISPVRKTTERRSKRPLLPIPVKIVGSQEKRMRLDFNGNNSEGNSSSTSASLSNESSGVSTPVTCPSSPPGLIANHQSRGSPSTLPSLFSQLNMTSIPPKPKTAASFNCDWKKLKPYSDMSAQYLKQMDEDDYLIFQDSMEYSVVSDILDLLVWEFLPRKWDFTTHLKGLLKVRRIGTLLLFMTEKDRANARKLISECPEDVQAHLKQQFCI